MRRRREDNINQNMEGRKQIMFLLQNKIGAHPGGTVLSSGFSRVDPAQIPNILLLVS